MYGRFYMFFILTWICRDKRLDDRLQLGRVPMCRRNIIEFGILKYFFKLQKNIDITAGKPVNCLPIVTDCKEFSVPMRNQFL